MSTMNLGYARAPDGYRAYAIGDVHGRLDLLEQLLSEIERDRSERPTPKALLVFVGDLIDRGPHSAQVIERLRTYRRSGVRTIFLLGNHEEVLLRILRGDHALISSWLRFGGLQCLESYGVDPKDLRRRRTSDVLLTVQRAIPQDHVGFLESFMDTCR